MKSRTVTFLLAFFLGGLGFHRFYLGETSKGVMYLLFCWTFIPVILAIIDFFRFIAMSDDVFNAKYNDSRYIAPQYTTNSADEIEKLYSLKERGIINQAEFEKKKRELL